MKELHFQAFVSGTEVQIDELSAEEHVDLIDMWQVEQGIQLQVTHSGAGLFECFALCGLLHGCALLPEAGRHGPVAPARFHRTPTEHHEITPNGDPTRDA